MMPQSKYAHGWIEDPDGVDEVMGHLKHPRFTLVAHSIQDSGTGKTVLLHQYVKEVVDRFPVRNQGSIGSCVAVASAGAVDTLQCVEIVRQGKSQEFRLTCAEAIYGFSRVEVGGGRLGRGDGSLGAWAARAVSEFGILAQQSYDEYDLSRYSVQRCRDWGNRGVPDELEPTAREHPVRTVSQIRSYTEARDAIANGYPVTFASNQGFSTRRDAEGFSRPSGSWAHQMYALAADDQHHRPGLLIMNSWGPSWISGPKRHEQPDGSFWADAEVIDHMCRSGDCWAYSDFEGFPPKRLDWASIV